MGDVRRVDFGLEFLALGLEGFLQIQTLSGDRDAKIKVLSVRLPMIERVALHFERHDVGAKHDLIISFISAQL